MKSPLTSSTLSHSITKLLVRSTLLATFLLGCLLLIYDISTNSWVHERVWVLLSLIGYLLLAEFLLIKGSYRAVSWLFIIYCFLLACVSIILWGAQAPFSLLTVGFVAILPSVLVGARFVIPVVIGLIVLLVSTHLYSQQLSSLVIMQQISTSLAYLDIILYTTVLIIFSLTAWVIGTQREQSLKRALSAERALRKQKKDLKVALEKESSALRLSQLSQMRQFYKFALIGQSTAATLHDLSTHLSILNLDIDDLQHNVNAETITSAKDDIRQINNMVRQTRRQLDSYDTKESINAVGVITQSVKDLDDKFRKHGVQLIRKHSEGRPTFMTRGNPLALMHIVSILLNNAIDACRSVKHPQVRVSIHATAARLRVSIQDNGCGISPDMKARLFKPVRSAKSAGLGVGLYIAQNLAVDQFGGLIETQQSEHGALFTVTIPKQ